MPNWSVNVKSGAGISGCSELAAEPEDADALSGPDDASPPCPAALSDGTEDEGAAEDADVPAPPKPER